MKLVGIEAREPGASFVATDGTRFNDEEGSSHVGRVYILHDGQQLTIFGGEMDTHSSGLERHSYDAEMHAFMRKEVMALIPEGGDTIRLLYGGSVKPSNAAEILAVENVDGALVGGASLKSKDFMAIAAVYAKELSTAG